MPISPKDKLIIQLESINRKIQRLTDQVEAAIAERDRIAGELDGASPDIVGTGSGEAVVAAAEAATGTGTAN